MVDTVSGSSSGCARHSSLKGVLVYVEISSHSVPVQPAILPLATLAAAVSEVSTTHSGSKMPISYHLRIRLSASR